MSAQTADGDAIPPAPTGWTRVHPGRPLLAHDERDKLALQWCPICGPGTTFLEERPGQPGQQATLDGGVADEYEVTIDAQKTDEHIAKHRPAQFGLTEFGEVQSGVGDGDG